MCSPQQERPKTSVTSRERLRTPEGLGLEPLLWSHPGKDGPTHSRWDDLSSECYLVVTSSTWALLRAWSPRSGVPQRVSPHPPVGGSSPQTRLLEKMGGVGERRNLHRYGLGEGSSARTLSPRRQEPKWANPVAPAQGSDPQPLCQRKATE